LNGVIPVGYPEIIIPHNFAGTWKIDAMDIASAYCAIADNNRTGRVGLFETRPDIGRIEMPQCGEF
jgi:hypothetical protein